MKYELHETLFWQVARPEHGQRKEPTAANFKKADKLIGRLRELESERVELFAELRKQYGVLDHDYIYDRLHGLAGYWSDPWCQSAEDFTRDQVTELNAKGILTEGQHYAVTDNNNPYQLPLNTDRILSRRELTKILGWSNDKITARLNLENDPLPVLTKGENGAPDKYSAMSVYRWLLRQEHARHPMHDSDVNDWKDAGALGEYHSNNPKHTRCPGRISLYQHEEIRPDLF